MITPHLKISFLISAEICEDVKGECSKFGRVLELKVPRPAGGRQNPGVGKIFVKFEDHASAQKALQALAGRKFADRTVVVTHFAEVSRMIFSLRWDGLANETDRNTSTSMLGSLY